MSPAKKNEDRWESPLCENVKERSEDSRLIYPAQDQWPHSLQMKSKLPSFLSSTVTHVKEKIEAKIEQEVKGKVTSDF